MMRRIVKHGPSSYIVSLPLDWIKKSKVAKGDYINVEEVGNTIVISASGNEGHERLDLEVNQTGAMTSEIIEALYKRGVDEIRLEYSTSDDFKMILDALQKDAVGYEIIATTKSSCTLKSITDLSNEFDNVLRRVFLVTISLAEEGLKTIKEKNYESLQNINMLERSNNKLTTFCRRYLNKRGVEGYDRIGPLYYIVETLEKIADEYKYLFNSISKMGGKSAEMNKKLLQSYDKITEILRVYYECFYKLDLSKLNKIKILRDDVLKTLESESKSICSPGDVLLYHHAMNLIEKVFGLLDPLIVLSMKEKQEEN